MNYSKFLIFIGCNLFVFSATAQTNKRDSIIPNQTIEINQIYKPEIAKPVKPIITPSLPKIEPAKPQFDYVVPQQTLSYTYHSVPIRPLALGKQEMTYPFENYVKAGIGNLSSIYFDAGIGSLHGENYNTTFHVSHLSQSKVNTQKGNSNTTIDAAGEYKLNTHTLFGNIELFRQGYKYYGYDESLYQYPTKSIRQSFTGGNITLAAANNTPNEFNINYKPELNFGMFGDHYNNKEQHVEINLPASYNLSDNYVFSLGLKANITTLKRGLANENNNYFQINPAFHYKSDQLQANLALSPTLGKGNIWYLLPDISVRTELFNKKFALVAGWKGSLIQNTYQQLSNKNPFLLSQFPTKQTKSDYAYGGFETKLGEHLAFGANSLYKSEHEFEFEFTKNGAYHNAYTTDTSMVYEADCADFEWDRILNLQKVAICTPKFNEDELNAEKGNVRGELTNYLNNHHHIKDASSHHFHIVALQYKLKFWHNISSSFLGDLETIRLSYLVLVPLLSYLVYASSGNYF